MSTFAIYDPGSGERSNQFPAPGQSATEWHGPNKRWDPPPDLVSRDPAADPGYGPEATHGPIPTNIVGGPLKRGLTSRDANCVEYSEECDAIGEVGDESDGDVDDSPSPDPHDADYENVTGDFDDDLDAADHEPNIRGSQGIGFVPTSYRPPQGVTPFVTRAGAVQYTR
jgi:hypothetical protein